MEDALKEKIIKVIRAEGMGEEILDDDMVLILDDLTLDASKLKKMLMEKGMDEIKAMEAMREMASAIMTKDDDEMEDDEIW